MNIYWIFITLFLFCIYILFGLHITEGLDNTTHVILYWVIYTILWITVLNIFTLGYFWSVIMKKTGPYGIRGPIGEIGNTGMDGACNVNASKLYCMKILNDYINDLYKSKTNKDILNIDTQTFPCKYLNEKIQRMSGSRQFDVVAADLATDGKSIDNIINYLKSIWKIWFDLIYNATAVQGVWFTDEFADETGGSDYEWLGSNPFDEIKKYDVYYWGITRDFRPLKAELCRSNSAHGDSKFPKHQLPKSRDVQVQRLKVIETNDYYPVQTPGRGTSSSDDNVDASIWSPKVKTLLGDTYYPIGDIFTAGVLTHKKKGKTILNDYKDQNQTYDDTGDNGPDMKTILVAGDVVDPISYKVIETTAASNSDDRMWISIPECPDGYQSLGTVVKSHSRDYNDFKCIPSECVEVNKPHTAGVKVWSKNHRFWDHAWVPGWARNWDYDVNVLEKWDNNPEPSYENSYNGFRVPAHDYPYYKIKKSCLVKTPNKAAAPLPQIPPPSTKEVENINADLGIGWYGHPYKLDPKYSIFTFLNLVPEGMIVNQGTGQRFYIVHKEGSDINLFNIFTYNNNTNKFNGSLQINIKKIIDPNDANLPNNKDYPNNSSVPTRVADPNANDPIPEPIVYTPPIKRVIITKLDKNNYYQQWKIMLNIDKSTFKMKNTYDNTYLIITQEPTEGLVEFSTIDLYNNNYLNDPAFNDLDQYELDNRTNFTFISSFGPQLDIIDNDDTNTTNI